MRRGILLRQSPQCFLVVVSLFMVESIAPLSGQTTAPLQTSPVPNSPRVASDYLIGPRDVLAISVADMPEIREKENFRVTDAGYILLPTLHDPLKAEGLTASELSERIAQSLRDADILRDPIVNVYVEEFHSRTVTVLGAVAKPSVYPLEKPTTLLEALSKAGGLTPTSGRALTIMRKGPLNESNVTNNGPGQAGEVSQTIDLAKLMQGKDPSLNIEVRDGDVISVSTAPIIYVVGAVGKPGGFALQDPSSGLTVLQALAEAQGYSSVAKPKESLIIRRSASGQDREKIPINLKAIMEGKLPDQWLEANDILFVPESAAKRNLHAWGNALGNGLITGVAIYGLGPKISK